MDILNKSTIVKLQGKWLWNYETPLNWPGWLTYIIPVLLAVLCSYLTKLVFVNDGQRLPLLLYFAIIMVFAAYGGTRASVVSAVCNIICAFLFFIYPAAGFNLQGSWLVQLGGLIMGSAFIIFLSDITRESHLLLKKQEENYRGIIEKSYEGFFTTDKNTHITYTCPSTSTLLGYSEPELKQTDYYSLIEPSGVDDFKESFAKLLVAGDTTLKVRHQLRTKANDWIWAEVSIKNLLFDERIKSVIYHFTDVTQKVHDELRQEDFVNIASHELKNPITALNGYMHLLKTRLNVNDDVKNVINRMDAQLYKMQSIISAMLDNTRIKAGELQYAVEEFDLIDCIKEAVDAIKVQNNSHEINCSFEADYRMVSGDKGKIGQVITNLITNAIKYSPQGERVEIATELMQNEIKVAVTDHGIGIAKEKQLKLFQRFYRVDTLPKKLTGLGLGLFIAAEIIRHHKGTIGVKSIEGDGSTFWFTLPL